MKTKIITIDPKTKKTIEKWANIGSGRALGGSELNALKFIGGVSAGGKYALPYRQK